MVRAQGAPASQPVESFEEKRLFMDLNEPFKGACGDCTLSCYRSHGANRDGPRNHLRPPCFTKLVADSSVEGGPSCWMKVPEAFVAKYLPHVSQKRMILENRDGARWPVTYSAAHGFQVGWSEFSTANELAVGETLFFSLVEENKFVVHVFEQSCCEKRLTTPSSSTRHRGKSVPDIDRTPTYTTQTSTPMPASKSFSRFRPDEPGMDIERELRFGENGERETSPGAFYGMPHRSEDDDNAGSTLQNQQRNLRNPKDGTSDTRKSQPPPRSWNNLSNIETGSFLDTSRRRSTPNLKGQSDSGYLRVKRMPMPKWGHTLSQLRTRAAVEKAKLKEMNLTDLPASEHRESSLKGNQNPSLKRKNVSVEASSDGMANFQGGLSEGRSFSKEPDAFISSRDRARLGCDTDDEEERATDLRNIQSYDDSRRKTITQLIPLSNTDQAFPTNIPSVAKMSSGRHGGSSSHQQQDSLEFASPRTPGRLQTDSLAGMSPEQMRVPLNGFKPKRGRPFKHHHPTPDSQQKQAREIFVSRRRPVTQVEKDEALTAAYSFAAHINASHKNPTTFILVMRQSFVYRNFVLGLPRGFGQRHMPSCSKEVTFVDSAWKAWLCSWNSTYSYIAGRGWRNFALEHCIEEDDVLLFHILSETDAMLNIKVHIFRVVPIPDGLTGWESHICPKNTVPEIHSGAKIQPMPHAEHPKHPGHERSHHVECPRLQSSRHQESAKKIKHEPASEVSESSEELD